jgi:malate dehydrogenase
MKRNKIAVVGGGQIGGILALLLAEHELGDVTIVDIPDKADLVAGKALDIAEALPLGGQDAQLVGSGDFTAIAGSDVVVVTAGIPRRPGMSRDDLLNVNLKIIRGVAEAVKTHAPEAFVILTTNPLDAMVYAFHKLSGLPKEQIAGMAGALDGGRFRCFIAMETGLSTKDVSAMVMGGHGPTMVPLVRTATVAGVPVTDLLSAEQIESIVQRTRDAGTELVNLYGSGSAYFSPAQSCFEMVEAYLKDKKRVISSAALCEGEFGIDGLFIGVPAVIGAGGIERIIEFPLTDDERAMLDSTIASVEQVVDETGL